MELNGKKLNEQDVKQVAKELKENKNIRKCTKEEQEFIKECWKTKNFLDKK